jgi:hypothetical protein
MSNANSSHRRDFGQNIRGGLVRRQFVSAHRALVSENRYRNATPPAESVQPPTGILRRTMTFRRRASSRIMMVDRSVLRLCGVGMRVAD